MAMSRYAKSSNAMTLIMTVSIILLQLLAKDRVQSARQEKCDDYSYEDQVTHARKYQRDLMRRLIKPCAKCVKKSLMPDANVSTVTQDGPVPRSRPFAETCRAV
jgi:hypothetical protein